MLGSTVKPTSPSTEAHKRLPAQAAQSFKAVLTRLDPLGFTNERDLQSFSSLNRKVFLIFYHKYIHDKSFTINHFSLWLWSWNLTDFLSKKSFGLWRWLLGSDVLPESASHTFSKSARWGKESLTCLDGHCMRSFTWWSLTNSPSSFHSFASSDSNILQLLWWLRSLWKALFLFSYTFVAESVMCPGGEGPPPVGHAAGRRSSAGSPLGNCPVKVVPPSTGVPIPGLMAE